MRFISTAKDRAGPSVESALVTLGVLALVVLLLAAVRGMPTVADTSLVDTGAAAGAPTGDAGTGGAAVTADGAGGPVPEGSPGAGAARPGAAAGRPGAPVAGAAAPLPPAAVAGCAQGRNAGATDVGVSATSIKLGATVVESGIGSSFLGPVRLGMQAVAKQVNRDGGVCGRSLDLVLKDDGWERQRGQQFIQSLVEDEKVFALAVVPSSEGLDAAAAYVDRAGVPVVGTNGLLASQYTTDWIWPVATATTSIMHIIAKEAHDRGARNFSLVYDRRFRFGLEGAFAFNEAVRSLTGADIPGYSDPFSSPRCSERFCGIQAGASSYRTEAQVLRDSCQEGLGGGGAAPCDHNALLLEPSQALTWYNSQGPTATEFVARGFGAAAAQPLFTREFARECEKACDQLVVWTGFNPPVERFAALPAVQRYVRAVEAESANADVNNQFLEGGYVGMQLLVEALRQAGPDLTRARLRQVLDTLTIDTGLTRPLTWTAGKFANRAAQGFRINYTSSFGGFTEVTEDWVEDPWL